MHLLIGLLAALIQREKTGMGQKVAMSMQDAVLNLCRVKFRDQERLDREGYLEEYPQYPNTKFGEAVPRGGNASGGGQPGWMLKCKGWQTDPNAYIYFTIQQQNWPRTCEAVGHPEWKDDPNYATAKVRQPHIFKLFKEIEVWLADKTKYEAVNILRKFEVPCAPVLSMKGIENDPALRASGTIVAVEEDTSSVTARSNGGTAEAATVNRQAKTTGWLATARELRMPQAASRTWASPINIRFAVLAQRRMGVNKASTSAGPRHASDPNEVR